jgi:hypothetical protein
MRTVDTGRETVERLAYGVSHYDCEWWFAMNARIIEATLRALLDERDAAYRAGAEAMRERAAEAVCNYIQETDPAPGLACDLTDCIRALPLEDKA